MAKNQLLIFHRFDQFSRTKKKGSYDNNKRKRLENAFRLTRIGEMGRNQVLRWTMISMKMISILMGILIVSNLIKL